MFLWWPPGTHGSSPLPVVDFSFLQNPLVGFLAINIYSGFQKASLGSVLTRTKMPLCNQWHSISLSIKQTEACCWLYPLKVSSGPSRKRGDRDEIPTLCIKNIFVFGSTKCISIIIIILRKNNISLFSKHSRHKGWQMTDAQMSYKMSLDLHRKCQIKYRTSNLLSVSIGLTVLFWTGRTNYLLASEWFISNEIEWTTSELELVPNLESFPSYILKIFLFVTILVYL